MTTHIVALAFAEDQSELDNRMSHFQLAEKCKISSKGFTYMYQERNDSTGVKCFLYRVKCTPNKLNWLLLNGGELRHTYV